MTAYQFPLDNGFLRRECPNCLLQFKWHHGPTEDAPTEFEDVDFYYCPYCGEPAAVDQWWTAAQVTYLEQLRDFEATKHFNEAMRGLNTKGRKGLISVAVKVNPLSVPSPPTPLVEPPDMTAVASPCHSWEPVKILDDWSGPVHCILCGQPYQLD